MGNFLQNNGAKMTARMGAYLPKNIARRLRIDRLLEITQTSL